MGIFVLSFTQSVCIWTNHTRKNHQAQMGLLWLNNVDEFQLLKTVKRREKEIINEDAAEKEEVDGAPVAEIEIVETKIEMAIGNVSFCEI